MSKDLSYTIEEVAQLLKVSKLTIYDLIKKGEIPVFRVGRQMRMDADDLNAYIQSHKKNPAAAPASAQPAVTGRERKIVISGQDLVLDILGKHIEKKETYQPLRSYTGSLTSLISMYHGECDIVSMHMLDGDTGEYNVPYAKKVLVNFPFILVNLVSRKAGLYVQKGNPLKLSSWEDLHQKHVTIINREKGSGARTLLDEQLRILSIPSAEINGYEKEETSHLSIASAINARTADAGVGIEKTAKIAGVDFIPLINERMDLVILKTAENEALIRSVLEILTSPSFQLEIGALGDYDTSQMGQVLYETF